MSDLENEARTWTLQHVPHVKLGQAGQLINDTNPTAEQAYIAGHQSAERKSAARIAELESCGTGTSKYAEAVEWRDWVACDLICEEHNGLQSELRKTREMVRELVGALSLYANPKSWDPDKMLVASHRLREDMSETDWSRFTPGAYARITLEKYKTEIAQLGREQNGASSTKLMGGME